LRLNHRPAKNAVMFDRPPAGLAMRTLGREGKVQAWLMADGRPLLRCAVYRNDPSSHPRQHSAMLAEGRVAVISVTNPRRLAIWDSATGALDPAGAPQPRLLLPA